MNDKFMELVINGHAINNRTSPNILWESFTLCSICCFPICKTNTWESLEDLENHLVLQPEELLIWNIFRESSGWNPNHLFEHIHVNTSFGWERLEIEICQCSLRSLSSVLKYVWVLFANITAENETLRVQLYPTSYLLGSFSLWSLLWFQKCEDLRRTRHATDAKPSLLIVVAFSEHQGLTNLRFPHSTAQLP